MVALVEGDALKDGFLEALLHVAGHAASRRWCSLRGVLLCPAEVRAASDLLEHVIVDVLKHPAASFVDSSPRRAVVVSRVRHVRLALEAFQLPEGQPFAQRHLKGRMHSWELFVGLPKLLIY